MADPSPSPPLSFTTSPSLTASPFAHSPAAFLAANTHIHRLIAGAIVFSPATHILLLRRAPTDSFPLQWEVPGGSVDADDTSLLSAAARELWEESSLRASHVVCAVGLGERQPLPVNTPLEESEEMEIGGGETVCVFREGQTTWAKTTFLMDVEDGEVGIREDEHVEWAWVSEEEVISGKFADGRALDIVSEGVRRAILEGFRIQKQRTKE